MLSGTLTVRTTTIPLIALSFASSDLPRSLRFTGESDDEFRRRAERTAAIARVLTDACFANECVREYLADPDLPFFDEPSVRVNPIVRIEYEEAIAYGGIGETLAATSNKHWGTGPQVLPIEPTDWFYATRITYRYRENSVYNRRFLQRKQMKELLGKKLRPLVEKAKYKHHGWEIFRDRSLTPEIEREIEERLGLTAKEFWRAARGRLLLSHLPLPLRQMRFDFGE